MVDFYAAKLHKLLAPCRSNEVLDLLMLTVSRTLSFAAAMQLSLLHWVTCIAVTVRTASNAA